MAMKKKVKVVEKRAVSKRVAKLAEKVIARILEEPRRFEMSIVARKLPKADIKAAVAAYNLPPCGTTGCLAGWALIEDAKMRKAKSIFVYNPSDREYKIPNAAHWQEKAEKLFGFKKWSVKNEWEDGKRPSDKLFNVSMWPVRFRNRYTDARLLS